VLALWWTGASASANRLPLQAFQHWCKSLGRHAEVQPGSRAGRPARGLQAATPHLWPAEGAQLPQHALLLHLVEQRHVQRDVEGRSKLHLLWRQSRENENALGTGNALVGRLGSRSYSCTREREKRREFGAAPSTSWSVPCMAFKRQQAWLHAPPHNMPRCKQQGRAGAGACRLLCAPV